MINLTYVELLLEGNGFNRGVIDGVDYEPGVFTAARRKYKEFRARFGYEGAADVLTAPEAQPKMGKSERPAFGLMLVPANGLTEEYWPSNRAINLCPRASAGCRAVCLAHAGHGQFDATQKARSVRTAFLLAEPYWFGVLVGAEIRKARFKHGDISLRLNVVSDIRWELVAPGAMKYLISLGVRMYDYTAWQPKNRGVIDGYHLTYSAKEPAHTPDDYLTGILEQGATVAMPFAVKKGQDLPETWEGFKVIDGDLSDDRTLDPSGVIVGLRQKGRGVDTSGFIRAV